MKKLLIILPLLFFLVISPALAQNNQSVSSTITPTQLREQNLEELRIRLQEKIEEQKKVREENRVTVRARLSEMRQERIRTFFGRLTIRFEAAIARLERLISRIESRLETIKVNNEEVEAETIEGELAEAKEKLAEAETALEEAETSLEEILNAEDPKAAFEYVRELIMGIKEQLKEVHQILVEVIGDIKGLRVGQEGGE